MSKRLHAMGQPNYAEGFKLCMHEQVLEQPLLWKKPRTIFVNSMSDLFHKDVPLRFIRKAFETMVRADWHTFQILTKRASRLCELSPKLAWPSNIWMGVSVESQKFSDRINHLKNTGAQVKFLSLEPLLGPIPALALKGIDWVIVGGESGPNARPIDPSWVIEIKNQCVKSGVPFFFKQWGGPNKKKAGRLLEGREWSQWPETAMVKTA